MSGARTCVEDYCARPVQARGLCSRHYQRAWSRDRVTVARGAAHVRAGLAAPAITHSRPRPRWGDRAACVTVDPALFDVEYGKVSTKALALCAACPVRLDCLLDSLRFEILPGTVVAGMTHPERERFAVAHPELVTYVPGENDQ